MTEIRDHFPDLDGLDVVQLHARREEILSRHRTDGNLDFMSLPDDTLAELLQVTRCLRRKAASPGGAPRGRKKESSSSSDDLS